MGNCHGSSYDEAVMSTIARSFPSSAGLSGPITATRVFSESTQSNSSGGNSLFSLAASGSLIGEERDQDHSSGEILGTPNLRIFSFSELKSAAKGFRPNTVLGEGGFGRVHKGWIDDKSSNRGAKIVVAIKKLNSQGVQGFEQWQSEVNFLGSFSHPNLVKLLGYCWEDKELLLVYEYMQKGSLENHLFRRSVEVLSWDRRLSIALGAAQGLAFLHNLDRQIIYRDFKASNVLLDGYFNPKLSDFGLAKFGPSGEISHVTTRIMGTYGYAAPEYVSTGHLYVKSDVYGFGVVMLEILTGLRAIDPNRPVEQQNLIEFTKNILSSKRKLLTIMDRRIDGQYPFKAALETAQLTQKCLRQDPRTRPSMMEVVETLQLIKALSDRSKQAQRTGSNSLKSEASSDSHRRVALKGSSSYRLT